MLKNPIISNGRNNDLLNVESSFGSVGQAADSHEGSEVFSYLVLDYIDQMLMEEDIEGKLDGLQSHPGLEATERPFYEIIGEKYPPPPDVLPLESSPSSESSDGHRFDISESPHLLLNSEYADWVDLEAQGGDPSDSIFKCRAVSQFEEALKEAKKLIPSENEKGRRLKNRHDDDSNSDLEYQRSSKQTAVSFDEPPVSSEMLDSVLLICEDKFPKVITSLRESIHSKSSSEMAAAPKPSRRKKQESMKEVVDLQTLLIHCAQTVAEGDHKRSYELLGKIQIHASPCGDASQRIAHYFAKGLEARLAGTGSQIHQAMSAVRRTLADVLKAYQLYLTASPFKQLSYYYANDAVLDAIEGATRVHILDFGIYLGFHWPAFLKKLASRAGGPPKLRLTGIELPVPGFRPTEMLEETGRRISNYAERFGVPFEYNAVATKLEDVRAEDLDLRDDEVLVVNCLFRLNGLGDEIAAGLKNCPRDKFLRTVRQLNPAVFVTVASSGAYGAPFFVTRFREALYHFSGIFDMMDATTPRENVERMLVERDLYGRYAINAIACEGPERLDRPETYKQLQVRCTRAGFQQLPLNQKTGDEMKRGVKAYYHKDFSIDEDGNWLLQGWRGRIYIAMCAWKPVN